VLFEERGMTEGIERLDVEAALAEDELLGDDELADEALDRGNGGGMPICCSTRVPQR
jgi:hypothetical protein